MPGRSTLPRLLTTLAVLAVASVAITTVAAAATGATAGAAPVTHPEVHGWMHELGTKIVEYGPLTIFVAFVISGIGLHLSEDFILIPAGIFAYEHFTQSGHWGWFVEAGLAAWLGIIVGDAGWIWICRHFGGKLLGWRTFRKLIGPRTLLEMKYEMDKRGAWALFIARFIPGLRTPMVTMAGLMQLAWWRILLVEAIGVMITVPLQMAVGVGVAKSAEQLTSPLHRWILYIASTLAVVGLMFVAHKLIQRRRNKRRGPRAPMRWLSGFSRTARAQRARRTSTEVFGQPG